MVEAREWGDEGARMPELQAKFGTYLTFALDGQLREDHPSTAGKPICFELRTVYPPTWREQQLLDIVTRQYLQPEGITFRWSVIGEGPV